MVLKHFKLASDLLGLSSSSGSRGNGLEKLRGLPFWSNDNNNFNVAIGLPHKNGIQLPMFDYEIKLFNELFSFDGNFKFKDKHLWVLKSTGLGITELFLRIIAWLCTRDDSLKGSQICIVTGPRIELAITLIDRLKGLFYNKLGVVFQNKETVLELNGVRIDAYPSHHLDSMRGLANVSFILLDEADFFPPGEQREARDISERYIAKSNPYIVLTSTPNRPGSLFDTIEREAENQCIYKRVKLPYDVGLGRIYTKEEIDKQRQSPSFKREFECQYLGTVGNVFAPQQVDAVVKLGQQYKDIAISQYTLKTIGFDPGFSSSASAAVMLEHVRDKEEKIILRYSQEWDHADPNYLANILWDLHVKYHPNIRFLCDGSNRAMINLLKIKFGEPLNWESSKKINPDSMEIIPVNFATEHKQMLSHLHQMVAQKYLVIPEEHEKLIISLKTAYANELSLNKEQTSYNDLIDGLRLALKGYQIK
jgi:hypothetical protein